MTVKYYCITIVTGKICPPPLIIKTESSCRKSGIGHFKTCCSVSCCQRHRDRCKSKADFVAQPANLDAPQDIWREKRLNAEGSSWSVDDILTEDDEDDRVPLEKLQLLGESEELKGILHNPHLQRLLLSVDRAEDKNALLKKYMQEPLFVEFADCCLRTVEPSEKENDLPR
ncbi:hypothetical protein JRQ81_008145 [Phrynocephalus forsythii]|uniref:Zinc finger HIT domain-containing protein n=1 Tax=Phrynocephalus forsythii TaxID=171643 RepID=A0A9Q0XEQ2_9SAUR|nr:hypothetical protein JRQ81_008145 [Phrynocephalus forsythii]